ncbi:MAG: uroporphyrinogen-III C-methyltransferase [Cyclobacteriaceae bacterium]|nr:uroporphyrinogen-III C-methyltransferase [Cyclobacteriaceae bacterium]
MIPNSKLTLIGAGPGDPELITVKGKQVLEQADVVLYDALVNLEMLNWTKNSAEKVFVGKRKDHHEFTQTEINEMIVSFAQQRKHVVRLKGGDPFVFGRGFEELAYVQLHGIPTEYIPGITSAIGVPGLNRIPVTHRGTSESFWVLTATRSDGSLTEDIHIAVKTHATTVLLMGMHKLADIVKLYLQNNKGDTPIAIIQNGSTEHEKIGIGTILTIEEVVRTQKLSAPAIIIIGKVVSLRNTIEGVVTNHKAP